MAFEALQKGLDFGRQLRTRKLVGPAMMGEPGAMEELMAFNPQIGMNVQGVLADRKQKQLQQQQEEQKFQMELSNFYQGQREFMDDYMEKTGKMMVNASPEQRRKIYDQRLDDLKSTFPAQKGMFEQLQWSPEREAGLVSLGTGKPLVQVSATQTPEGAAAVEQAKIAAKSSEQAYSGYLDRGEAASTDIRNLNAAIKFSELAPEGATATLEVLGGKAAEALGIDSELAKRLPAAEGFQMLTSNMVLDAGQKLSGAMSDGDIALLERTGPQLSQTKEGRKMILEMKKAMAQREIDMSKLARKYKRDNKVFDRGEFLTFIEEKYADNPVFNNDLVMQVIQSSPITTPTGKTITFEMLKAASPGSSDEELLEAYLSAMGGQ